MDTDAIVATHYSQGDLHVGDVFVLVSDGVHNVLPARRLKALITENAQDLSELLVQTAVEQGSGDNCTALVVRVLSVLDATLQDENRLAQQLTVPPRLKVGDTIDGVAVTSVIVDNGINILYQVRAIAPTLGTGVSSLPPKGAFAPKGGLSALKPQPGKLYALKTLNPQRAHDAHRFAAPAVGIARRGDRPTLAVVGGGGAPSR